MISIFTNAFSPLASARKAAHRPATVWSSGAAALGQVCGQSGLTARRAELLSLAESMQADQPHLAARLRAASSGQHFD